MLDWIFEGIAEWIGGIVSSMMDAVSGIFLGALGADMTTMEEYFPFVKSAFSVLQYTAWALLFLITVWQLFRSLGGPLSEAENPWQLVARSALFAVLIAYAKPIFEICLSIARAPYLALMDSGTDAAFTFAGIESTLTNGLTTVAAASTIVGLLLMIILLVSLGWNYFKLLLEVVERYIVVGVMCYTSPLAFAAGGSKATQSVFRSWCKMVGSQLLLLVLNVWFLRGFASSVGQFLANGGALTSGSGNIFLWLFCALAYLKTAQRFDSYLSSLGLNVAQTGSSMGMEILMASRALSGMGGGGRNAGSVFGGGPSPSPAPSSGFSTKFAPNSFVRDAVVDGGSNIAAGGGLGFVGRSFGAVAANHGAVLSGPSIASVAARPPATSGTIAGDIADRSLGNYMPHLQRHALRDTSITGGRIQTTASLADGKTAALSLFDTNQFEVPSSPYSLVTAEDGSQWYQMASGEGMGAFYSVPSFDGSESMVADTFPGITDTSLRTVDDGVLEACSNNGTSLWYNSALYDEPAAPHDTVRTVDGVGWYALHPNASVPELNGEGAFDAAQFHSFMPGFSPASAISSLSPAQQSDGYFEVLHQDGSGTRFYDCSQYGSPRGDYKVYEDSTGHQWFAIDGTPAIDHVPMTDSKGQPLYENGALKTTPKPTIRYRSVLTRFASPEKRNPLQPIQPPKRK